MLHIWSDDLTLAGSQIDLTLSVANSKEIVRSERLYISIKLEADEKISMKTDSSQQKEHAASESAKTVLAFAEALHVAEPFKVISKSQQVMQIDETTNLKQAAKFDFYGWCEAKGLEIKPKFSDEAEGIQDTA